MSVDTIECLPCVAGQLLQGVAFIALSGSYSKQIAR